MATLTKYQTGSNERGIEKKRTHSRKSSLSKLFRLSVIQIDEQEQVKPKRSSTIRRLQQSFLNLRTKSTNEIPHIDSPSFSTTSIPTSDIITRPISFFNPPQSTLTHIISLKPLPQNSSINVHPYQFFKNLEPPPFDTKVEKSIQKNLYPYIERLLLSELCSKSIYTISHKIISHTKLSSQSYCQLRYPENTAYNKVHTNLPNLAPHLLNERFRVVNFYVLLNGSRCKQYLADSNRIDEKDLFSLYDDADNEYLGVASGEGQEWFYCDLKSSEGLLMLGFDSQSDYRGCGRGVISDKGKEEREDKWKAIEIECLVFG